MDEKTWAAVAADIGKGAIGLIGRTLFIALIAVTVWFFGPAETKVVMMKVVDLYMTLVKTSVMWEKATLIWLYRWLNGPLWGKQAKKVPWYRRRKTHLILLPILYLPGTMILYIVTTSPFLAFFPILFGALATGAAALIGLFVWAAFAWGGFNADLVQRPVIAGITGIGAALKQVLSDEDAPKATASMEPFINTKAFRDGGAKFAYGLTMLIASFVFWNLAFRSLPVFFALYAIAFGIVALVCTGKLGDFAMRKGLELYYRLLALAVILGAIFAVVASALPKTYHAVSTGSGFDSALANWLGGILTVVARVGRKVWDGTAKPAEVVEVGFFFLLVVLAIGFAFRILRIPVHKVGEVAAEGETDRRGVLVGLLAFLIVAGTVGTAYAMYRAQHPEPEPPPTAAAAPVGPTTHTVVVVNQVPTPAVSQPRPAPTRTGGGTPRGGTFALANARYCQTVAAAVGTAGPSTRDFEVACRGEALASGIALP